MYVYLNCLYLHHLAGIYRESRDDIALSKVPVQPISRGEAETLLRYSLKSKLFPHFSVLGCNFPTCRDTKRFQLACERWLKCLLFRAEAWRRSSGLREENGAKESDVLRIPPSRRHASSRPNNSGDESP